MSTDDLSGTEDQPDYEHHEIEGPGYSTPAAMRTATAFTSAGSIC
jgi:selenium-binding protein 1